MLSCSFTYACGCSSLCDCHYIGCCLECRQDDKDLVHEFVNNDGLDCLIRVGAEADLNYQNYILRGGSCDHVVRHAVQSCCWL